VDVIGVYFFKHELRTGEINRRRRGRYATAPRLWNGPRV